MKRHPYILWLLIPFTCICLYLFAIAIFPGNSSFASARLGAPKTPSAVPTVTGTQLTLHLQPTPEPKTIWVLAPSSYFDPPNLIAIIVLFVQIVSLGFIIKYVKDTASMARSTRDSADATRDSAKAAENTVQEMKAAREEESAPHVVVYFDYVHTRHHSLYLELIRKLS